MGARRTDGGRDLGQGGPRPRPLEAAEPTQLAPAPVFPGDDDGLDRDELDDDLDDDRPVLALGDALVEDGPTEAAEAPTPAPRLERSERVERGERVEARTPERGGARPNADPPASGPVGSGPMGSGRVGSARAIVERAAPGRSEGRSEAAEPRAPVRERAARIEPPRPASSLPASPGGPAAAAPGTGRLARPEPLPLPVVDEVLRSAEPRAKARARRDVLRLGLPAVAVVFVGIVGVFAWSTQRSEVLKARHRTEGVTAREHQGSRPAYFRSYKDEVQAASPDLVVRSPLPLPAGKEVAPAEKLGVQPGSAPKARRRGGLAVQWGFRQPTDGGKEAELRYGFEVPERPKKRDYETSEEAPSGMPPMLMIFTDPPGVAVDVDGKLMGVTPMLRPVAKDKTTVDVRLWGGAYVDQRFTLKKGKDGNFQLGATMELKPRPAPAGTTAGREGWISAGPAQKEQIVEEPPPPPPPPPPVVEEGSK